MERKTKVAIINVILKPEAWEVDNKQIEAAIRVYLNLKDIPFCEKIEKVKILVK